MPHPFHAYMRKQALVTPFSKPGMKDNTGRWLKAEEPIPDRVVEETNYRRKNLPAPAQPAKPGPGLKTTLNRRKEWLESDKNTGPETTEK